MDVSIAHGNMLAQAYDDGFCDAARMLQDGLAAIGAQWDEKALLEWAKKHDVREERFLSLRGLVRTPVGKVMLERLYAALVERNREEISP